ncbi:hypothetical protein [Streptomyces sp. CC208A]|uniref:hypothetical protein n=1 Tax=Streptomyces sp. CC208A TaxID=3044573 RepID=UPI0024A94D5B|nr:hypothetical protein [Streptomyces sp. CC208A]
MSQLIRALVAWARVAFRPPAATATPAPSPYHRRTPPTALPLPLPLPLPAPRSPYGLDLPLDGAASVLVRPYLVAEERRKERARQRQRRLVLVLAADFGIDLDTRDLHGLGVA